MYKNKFTSAIVTAAGSGTRMKSQTNKPYLEIGTRSVIEMTLETITSIEEFDEIIMVIRKADKGPAEKILATFRDPRLRLVYGGASREESTYKGLLALDDKSELVLTHDGVRPFASKELFYTALKTLETHKAVITATRSKDTIKVVNDDMEVDFTPNRDYVYNIQTPQAFDTRLIKSLYEDYMDSEAKITDDSQLFEFFKRDEPVKVIDGDYENIKITTSEDIIFAKAIDKRRRS